MQWKSRFPQKLKKIAMKYIILCNAMEIKISQKPKKMMYMIYIHLVKCNGNKDFTKPYCTFILELWL